MRTVFETDLRCNACVASVSPHIQKLPDVTDWSVDVAHPKKWLRVSHSHESTIAEIVRAVKAAGFSAIQVDTPTSHPVSNGLPTLITLGPAPLPRESSVAGESSGAQESIGTQEPNEGEASTKSPSAGLSWSRYKPLGLVLLYVAGMTAFVEWIAPPLHWHRAMSHFMGFFFLAFAFFKLLDVGKFATAFASYDVLAKRSRTYALAYPWLELVLGILFLSQRFGTFTNITTIGVMGIGLLGVLSALQQRRTIQCACLGTAFNLPMSIVTVIENGTMIAMAIAMLLLA